MARECALQSLYYADSMKSASETTLSHYTDGFQKGYRNFNAKLLAECYQGETMMVSPFSLYAALGMLGNGASGETLKEMEQLFGCSVEEASKAVLYLMLRSEEADVVRIADSIWIEDGTPVNDAFLSRCGLYYRSSVMRAHLPAESTIQKINDWVNEHTKGRIEKILDKIDDDDSAYIPESQLVNQLIRRQHIELVRILFLVLIDLLTTGVDINGE